MRAPAFGIPIATLAALAAVGACGPNETHPTVRRDPYRAGAETPLACVPNLDGKIESAEMRPAVGVTANFIVSRAGEEQAVDVKGRLDAGRLFWDWSVASARDQVAPLQASHVAGKWYASKFPADAFVANLDAGGSTEGVYQHTEGALVLLGVASREENPASGKTLLVYDRPVQLYRFPLEPGAAWVSTGRATNGFLRGLPWAQTDTYDVKVDSAGSLALPDLEFTQALRVRLQITLTPAVGMTVRQRQVSWLSECFGEVARATSKLGEDAEDFTTATEVRRLGLSPE